MSWERNDATGAGLREGDFCVGDTGRVYRLAGDQYSTGGDFINVSLVKLRYGRWVFDEDDTQGYGQYGGCVVRITLEELEQFARLNSKSAKKGLARFFVEHYPSRREMFLARQRMRKGQPRRLGTPKEE